MFYVRASCGFAVDLGLVAQFVEFEPFLFMVCFMLLILKFRGD